MSTEMDWIEEKNNKERSEFLHWFLNWCEIQKKHPIKIETCVKGESLFFGDAEITTTISPVFDDNDDPEILLIHEKLSDMTNQHVPTYSDYFQGFLKITSEEAISLIIFWYILFQDWDNRDNDNYSYLEHIKESKKHHPILKIEELEKFCLFVVDIYGDGIYNNTINYLIQTVMNIYENLPRCVEMPLNIIPPIWTKYLPPTCSSELPYIQHEINSEISKNTMSAKEKGEFNEAHNIRSDVSQITNNVSEEKVIDNIIQIIEDEGSDENSPVKGKVIFKGNEIELTAHQLKFVKECIKRYKQGQYEFSEQSICRSINIASRRIHDVFIKDKDKINTLFFKTGPRKYKLNID